MFTELVSVNTDVETPRPPATTPTLPRLQLSADAKEQRAKQDVARFLEHLHYSSSVCDCESCAGRGLLLTCLDEHVDQDVQKEGDWIHADSEEQPSFSRMCSYMSSSHLTSAFFTATDASNHVFLPVSGSVFVLQTVWT